MLPHDPFLRQALSAMGVGVVGADAAGEVTFLNPVAERMTGWPNEEARGRELQRVLRLGTVPDGGPVRVVPAVDAQQTDEAVLHTRGGETYSVEYVVAPVREEGGARSGWSSSSATSARSG